MLVKPIGWVNLWHGRDPPRVWFPDVIYTQDHEPAHVHVTGPGQAKINLLGPNGKPELIYSIGIRRPDMRRLMNEIAQRQTEFLQEWERIHGQRD